MAKSPSATRARPARAPTRSVPETPPPPRPPYLWAGVSGAVVFALYAITLAPTTAFWDASEYIATAHIMGIPHPPGNPLFVVMARAWELILAPFGLSVAVRVNLFSALMTAGASVFWFLTVHRILAYFTPREPIRLTGAAASVLLAATAFTVWNHSNVNEKVYTISLLTIALLTWLAFHWRDNVELHRGKEVKRRWHDDNALLLMIFILALSVGNHLMAFLAAPALGLLIVMVKPRSLLNWRLYGFGVLVAVVGLSVHLFLPIRAELNPVINEADPTCENVGEALVSVVTFGRAGCEDLSASLAREQYAKPPVTERQAPFWAQTANYFQYFDWQWSRSISGSQGYFPAARIPFTLLFLGLGIFGAVAHARRDRKSFLYMVTLFGTLSLGLVFYLNFKYGFMQAPALGLPQEASEVRERDYFFIISFAIWGLWAGIGLVAGWLAINRSVRPDGTRPWVGAPLMLIALIPLILNWSYASRAGDHAARDWAYNLLQSVEPYAVLFTNGDNDTFPLWYLQEVEGIRRDVQVMVGSYLNTHWYAKQVRDLTRPCPEEEAWRQDVTRIICQRTFDPDGAPAFYSENGAPPLPERSALPLTDQQIEQLTLTDAGWIRLGQDGVFEARGAQAIIPAGTVLRPSDQFMLTIIREAWGDRPVYFAATTHAHRRLGLASHVVRHGVAYRLTPPEDATEYQEMPADEPQSMLYGAYLDLERNRRLLDEVFIHRDLIDRPHWVDDATRQIPAYYAYAHISLGRAEELAGNRDEASRHYETARRWLELSDR